MQTGRVVLISVLTAALTSAIMFFALRAATGRGQPAAALEVEVPALTGISPEQARQMLQPRGLTLQVIGDREDPRFRPGQIAQQSPLDSIRVSPGTEVRVLVAAGPSGASPEPAASGSPASASARPVPASPPATPPPAAAPPGGRAVETSALTQAPADATQRVLVPSVVGKTPGRAAKILTDAGLKLGRLTYGSDEDRRPGVIIRQTPAAATSAAPGSAVNLTVNESE